MASDKKDTSGGASGTAGRIKPTPIEPVSSGVAAGSQPRLSDMSLEERNTLFRTFTKVSEESPYLNDLFLAQNLTMAQKKALTAYKDKWRFPEINNQLRTGIDRGATEEINALNSIDYRLKDNVTLYRGVNADSTDKFFRQMVKAHKNGTFVDSEFSDKGFSSTSLLTNKAFGGRVQYTIRAPKGARAIVPDRYMSSQGAEAEIILAANTRFRVINSTYTGYAGEQILRVEVEVIV